MAGRGDGPFSFAAGRRRGQARQEREPARGANDALRRGRTGSPLSAVAGGTAGRCRSAAGSRPRSAADHRGSANRVRLAARACRGRCVARPLHRGQCKPLAWPCPRGGLCRPPGGDHARAAALDAYRSRRAAWALRGRGGCLRHDADSRSRRRRGARQAARGIARGVGRGSDLRHEPVVRPRRAVVRPLPTGLCGDPRRRT